MVKVRVSFDVEYEDTEGLTGEEIASNVELMLCDLGDGCLSLSPNFAADYDLQDFKVEVIEDTEPESEMAATLATICKR